MPIFNTAKLKFFQADIDLETDDIKVALLTSAYTPDIDTQEFWDDVSANEASATGYTAGGTSLTTKALTTDLATDQAEFDADDVTWTVTGSLTARYAIIYKDTGTPATSSLVAYIDFTEDKTSSDGDFTIQWSADGIFTLAQGA